MRVFIIGYMGSGKTTVGKKLARKLDLQFFDLDSLIEKTYNKSIERIFKDNGELEFREIESKVLKDISKKDNFILSTGGGTPCFNDNMIFITENGVSIYLKGTPEFLVSRLQNSKTVRPIIQGKSFEELHTFITNHLEERKPFYETATYTASAVKPDLEKLVLKMLRLQ